MFRRPVDHQYPIRTPYGEKGRHYQWSIDPDNGLWIPTPGKDGFGQHRGIDFDCPIGTIVSAMADGIIIQAKYESSVDRKLGAGLYIRQLVILPGYDSWVLRYTHLSSVHVEPGQEVAQGRPIAESGDTGDINRPLLHIDLIDIRKQWHDIPIDSITKKLINL